MNHEKEKVYINALVENMFYTDNDRLMMRFFLFRRVLDMTPIEVGKEFKISRIKVNQIIQCLPYRRLDSEKFNNSYKIALDAFETYYTQKLRKSHIEHLNMVTERLNNKRKEIILQS